MSDYFDNYFFTSNLTSFVCPGFGSFQCQPPNSCARDPNTGKRYCCDFDDVCWSIPSTCKNDGSTFNCGSGQDAWCCLDKTEICTGSVGQINVCWSPVHDTLVNISTSVLNKTFSSLSAASPSASSWTFDPATLIAATQTSSKTTSTYLSTSSSSTSTKPNISGETSTAPSSTATHRKSTSTSGGAIGGIVVAAIAVLALLALGIYFLQRHKKRTSALIAGSAVYEVDGEGAPRAKKPLGSMQELRTDYPASELQGNEDYLPPRELATNSPNIPHRY